MASSSPSRAPAFEAEGFGWVWPDVAEAGLLGVSLRVEPGECVFVGGASGSGKTTLLRAIAGVLPAGGRASGRLRVSGGRPAMLLQNVDTQLLCTRVDEEVAFGLALRGLPEGVRAARATRALDALGLAGFSARAVDDLSAGEKQRVVLAALLALEPGLLLLDEPSSQLDPEGRRRLAACLAGLKARGHALVLADHRFEPWAGLVDRRFVLKEGRLAPAAGPPEDDPSPSLPPPPAPGAPALAVEGLCVDDPGGRPVLREVSLSVAAGERVQLTGANGAGKSTLLRAIAGACAPAAGSVHVASGSDRPGAVALLFQNPERNLFERSVEEEVAFGLRRLGWGRREVARRVRDVLSRCGLDRLRDRSPLRLSFGEQHRVALAAVLAPGPRLLLLDEPWSGLDAESRAAALELLEREQAREGFALIVASHDPPPRPGWAHRQLVLADGRLAPCPR